MRSEGIIAREILFRVLWRRGFWKARVKKVSRMRMVTVLSKKEEGMRCFKFFNLNPQGGVIFRNAA